MDVLGLLLQLIFRAIVVVLPLTVAWLAFRRLMLSQTANAWVYATVCLFAAVTSAGLIPWTLGLGSGNWLIFLFSAISPAVWMTVIMIYDPDRHRTHYEFSSDTDPDVTFISAPKKAAANSDLGARPQSTRPLILEEPDWPEAPVPIFRHVAKTANTGVAARHKIEDTAETLLSIARDMRGNSNSDSRRPRLLPKPESFNDGLPFLNRG